MKEKLQLLFEKFLKGSALNEEKVELAELVAQESDDTLTDLLKSAWDQTGVSELALSEEQAKTILQDILTVPVQHAPVISIPFYKKASFRVAASVIFLLGVFAIIKLNSQKNINQPLGSDPVASVVKNDIAPGGNKATLQLADGSTIILDSSNNGNIANQGQTKIIKIDGQLAYNADGSSKEILYNTITTPRGGQYQLILADGTKVWLNAASSLHFPTSFVGKERKVTLTGEGYFEVAKNSAMPFKVDVAGKGEVEVLGTHFNVNAYADEANIKTTLLEGKVKANFGQKSLELFPNQQSVFKNESNFLQLKKDVDVNKVTSWKNGLFDFEDDDITDIMRQLARWYNVQIQYNGKITEQHFTGAIRRQVPVSQVLFMLQQAGGVEFNVINNKIEVNTK